MTKKSLLTALLAAAGLVTASAQTHTVYITGSTAFRSSVYNAATHSGGFSGTGIFDAAATTLPASATSSSQNVMYVGNIGGVPYILDCGWAGSEAGIANVAGKTSLGDVVVPVNWNGNAGQTTGGTTQNLPGIPYTFLDPTGNGTTFQASPRTADLAFADTSRAVSLTSDPTLTHEYGAVGVVPFVWTKGYSSSPSSSWMHLTNVTIQQLTFAISSSEPAAFFTGDINDTDFIFPVGRNRGSGTRVNTLLNIGFFPSQPVQYTAYSLYSGTSPNLLLALNTTWAVHAKISTATGSDVFASTPSGDGFDSGGNVAKILELDVAGASINANPIITLGYLSVSDSGGAEANGAVRLTLNGVKYNQGAVVNGTYSFYGYEHMYGQASPSTDANTAQTAIATGLNNYLVSFFSQTENAQGGIALSEMNANRPGDVDTGYPTF